MDQQTLVDQQDYMRPFRMFIGALSGAPGEQSSTSADGRAVNQPYGIQILGPTGYGVEGSNFRVTTLGGNANQTTFSPWLLLVGAYLLLK